MRIDSPFITGSAQINNSLAVTGSLTVTGSGLQVTGSAGVQGKLSVNTPTATSAVFEVTSTTQGLLPPRMTAAQKNAIASPAEGLIIVQTDGTAGLYLYVGGVWRAITMV